MDNSLRTIISLLIKSTIISGIRSNQVQNTIRTWDSDNRKATAEEFLSQLIKTQENINSAQAAAKIHEIQTETEDEAAIEAINNTKRNNKTSNNKFGNGGAPPNKAGNKKAPAKQQQPGRKYAPRDMSKYCYWCKRQGHSDSECFSKANNIQRNGPTQQRPGNAHGINPIHNSQGQGSGSQQGQQHGYQQHSYNNQQQGPGYNNQQGQNHNNQQNGYNNAISTHQTPASGNEEW